MRPSLASSFRLVPLLGLSLAPLACDGPTSTAIAATPPGATSLSSGSPSISPPSGSPSISATVSFPAAEAAPPTARPSGSAVAAPARTSAGIAADASAAERVAALAKDPPRPPSTKGAAFAGPVDVALDGEWLVRLASAEITEVTPNRGGSSITMRVRFKDGKKAALKPEQTGKPTDPRAEIAAYHLDRLLGFGRTAAVVGRSFALEDLRAALVASGADAAFLGRLDKLVVKDGRVDAAMIAWHSAPLVEEAEKPSWAAALSASEPVDGASLSRLAEWSDLAVFDFLIDNPDRLSGGNVLRLDKSGPLIFLDQGAAFGRGRARSGQTLKDRLDEVCRFRKETLAALRQAGSAAKDGSLGALLRKSLARDPIAPVLDEAQLAAVDDREKALEAHVRACSTRLGAASTLAPATR
jgi:hypothetical protein